MSTEYIPSAYEDGELYGTAIVRVSRNVQFGYRVQVYQALMEMSGTDVIPSHSGDSFSIPYVSKGTYRAIVDRLCAHPSCPSFTFKPRGAGGI